MERNMKESVAMLEIRKIRDENSLRRLSQTPEERKKELDATTEWFIKRIGKDIKIVDLNATSTQNAKAV